eukprot:Colp12_sorted_trinity150504_noHs@4000
MHSTHEVYTPSWPSGQSLSPEMGSKVDIEELVVCNFCFPQQLSQKSPNSNTCVQGHAWRYEKTAILINGRLHPDIREPPKIGWSTPYMMCHFGRACTRRLCTYAHSPEEKLYWDWKRDNCLNNPMTMAARSTTVNGHHPSSNPRNQNRLVMWEPSGNVWSDPASGSWGNYKQGSRHTQHRGSIDLFDTTSRKNDEPLLNFGEEVPAMGNSLYNPETSTFTPPFTPVFKESPNPFPLPPQNGEVEKLRSQTRQSTMSPDYNMFAKDAAVWSTGSALSSRRGSIALEGWPDEPPTALSTALPAREPTTPKSFLLPHSQSDSISDLNQAMATFMVGEKEALPKDPTTWTREQVQRWLIQEEAVEYSPMFAKYTGKRLCQLTEVQFKELCGVADGIILFNALSDIRNNQTTSTTSSTPASIVSPRDNISSDSGLAHDDQTTKAGSFAGISVNRFDTPMSTTNYNFGEDP